MLNNFWKRVLKYKPPWIFDKVISALVSLVVGAVMGAIIGYFVVIFAKEPSIIANVWTNANGEARPMELLFPPLGIETDALMTFDPAVLEQVTVCEYSRISGATPEEVILAYLSKYSDCFVVTEVRPKTWIVRTNKVSGEMKPKNGQWYCKCG